MSRKKQQPAPDLSYIVEELRPFAVPIDSIVLDPENARLHPDKNRESTRNSLAKRGQVLPITVRLANRTIMTGNSTVEEARALGWTHIAAFFYDYTAEQAADWAITHNLGATLAVWDYGQLAATIEANPEVDWIGVGFESAELESILEQAHVEMPPETTDVEAHEREIGGTEVDPADDEVPETPAEPITKVGDVIEIGPHTLHCCDCMDLLRSLPDNSIDAIVTDPPYGLSPDGRARTWDDIEELRREGKGPTKGFMGNAWDAGVPGLTWARECLRVLKPGGHLIAHSATRTVHRLACAIEDAGFEIRDQIGWLHWQGFPKSHDLSKAIDEAAGAEREVTGHHTNHVFGEWDSNHGRPRSTEPQARHDVPASPEAKRWDGWGTALKPACEPAVLARKPLSESTVAANVLRWGTGALNIDACRIAEGDPAWPGPTDREFEGREWTPSKRKTYGGYASDGHRKTMHANERGRWPANIYACPKPAGTERAAGTEHLPQAEKAQLAGAVSSDDPVSARLRSLPTGNTHPTVKPAKLYRWLLRLVTPPGGTALEPFGGSGTTLVAASKEGFRVIAAEREPKYCDIIRARVEHALLP